MFQWVPNVAHKIQLDLRFFSAWNVKIFSSICILWVKFLILHIRVACRSWRSPEKTLQSTTSLLQPLFVQENLIWSKPRRPTSLMTWVFKACIHIPSPSPIPSQSSFIIVPMVTGRLMDRMGSILIRPVRQPVTINTNVNLTATESETGSECLNRPLGWLTLKRRRSKSPFGCWFSRVYSPANTEQWQCKVKLYCCAL